jgi:putative membrane protein
MRSALLITRFQSLQQQSTRSTILRPLVVAVVFAIGTGWLQVADFGPLSTTMAFHILLMNVVALFLALSSVKRVHATVLSRGDVLATASVIQIGLLWAVHAPAVMERLSSVTLHLAMQTALFGTATLYWSAVFAQGRAHCWRALLALLITGKLFCLLGVLIVFSPRLLYASSMHDHGGLAFSLALSDQQFAGLMMIVACPLSYVLAAIVISARWLSDISACDPGLQHASRAKP